MYDFAIKEGKEPLEKLMKRMGVSYVYWYNWKHKRSDHLFQDRYKCEEIVQLQSMEKEIRDEILRKLKAIEGLSIRQIARIIVLNFNVVAKA